MLDETAPTVTVTEAGGVTAATPRGSYWQGLGDLLDFGAPPVRIAILSPGAPTALGFLRVSRALRDAMTAFGRSKL